MIMIYGIRQKNEPLNYIEIIGDKEITVAG